MKKRNVAIGRANAVAEAPARRYVLDDLLAVMARLRDKDAGCPWDVAQSYATKRLTRSPTRSHATIARR